MQSIISKVYNHFSKSIMINFLYVVYHGFEMCKTKYITINVNTFRENEFLPLKESS